MALFTVQWHCLLFFIQKGRPYCAHKKHLLVAALLARQSQYATFCLTFQAMIGDWPKKFTKRPKTINNKLSVKQHLTCQKAHLYHTQQRLIFLKNYTPKLTLQRYLQHTKYTCELHVLTISNHHSSPQYNQVVS